MPYSWWEEYFGKKVLPALSKEMQQCGRDFHTWLKEFHRGDHDALTLTEERINENWRKQGDKTAFKELCKEWVSLHLQAKLKYLAAFAPKPAPDAQETLV